MRIPYYYAVFKLIADEDTNGFSREFPIGHILCHVDEQSHPFIWLKIQKELGRTWICTFWKEISEEEFNYFIYGRN